MTELDAIVARWRAALDWRPGSRFDDAAAVGLRYYPGGWPGFPQLPFALKPLPAAFDLPHLSAGYREYDELNAAHFGDLCPPVKLVINQRLRTTAGRIDTARRVLELNGLRLAQLPETRIETIYHEMVHLWLYAQGLPCGHTAAFRAKMTERGHVSIGYGRDDDPKGPHHRFRGSERRVVYRCPGCGQEFVRRRRFGRAMACRACYDAGRGRRRLVEQGVIHLREVAHELPAEH